MFEIDVSPHTLTSAYGEFLFIKFQLLDAQWNRILEIGSVVSQFVSTHTDTETSCYIYRWVFIAKEYIYCLYV